MIRNLQDMLLSDRLYAILCLAAIVLIPLRLFGVLFFLSTISSWAFMPAVTIAALLALAKGPRPPPLWACLAVLTGFCLGIVLFLWEDTLARMEEGQLTWFDAAEAVSIALLFLRAWALTARSSATGSCRSIDA